MATEYCTFFDFCLPGESWVTLWGGVIGSAAAVIGAYLLERWRERRNRKAANDRLKASLEEVERQLLPFIEPDMLTSLGREQLVCPEVWLAIISADADLRWFQLNPHVVGSEAARSATRLASIFRRNHELIARAETHLAQHDTLHNASEFKRPDQTHWFARSVLSVMGETIKKL